MGKKQKKGDKAAKDKQRAAAKSAKQADAAKHMHANGAAQATAEIQEAEARLAAALRKVDDARAQLQQREQELTTILQKYDRLPSSPPEPTSVDDSTALESAALNSDVGESGTLADDNSGASHNGSQPDQDGT